MYVTFSCNFFYLIRKMNIKHIFVYYKEFVNIKKNPIKKLNEKQTIYK